MLKIIIVGNYGCVVIIGGIILKKIKNIDNIPLVSVEID